MTLSECQCHFLSVNSYCFLYKNFYSFFFFLFLGFLVAFYMARKNLGFCKQIEQWEGLYYIKKMIETLIFIKERMPLIINMPCLTLLVLVFFPLLNCNLFFQSDHNFKQI